MKTLTKTSKTFISLVLGLTLIALCFLLVACNNKPKITSCEVKSGTMATTIIQNSTLETSSLVVIFTYDDNSTKEVSSKDLEIGTIDTSTSGQKNLSIKYDEETYFIVINVVPSISDTFMVASLKSQLITEFNSNRQEQINKQTEFYDLEQPLYVGDDNEFDFRIIASGTDIDGQPVTNLTQVRTNIKVEVKNQDNSYTTLTGTELENIASINTEKTTIDFTENAIGKTFKITVSATNPDPEYDLADTSFVAEIQVIDGYNVYNAIQLSVFDNVNKTEVGNNTYQEGIWTDLKEQHNLTNVTTNAIILQNDIKITRNDVPEQLFWKTTDPNYSTILGLTDQQLEGSLIDDSDLGIYERSVSDGETFELIGNYFAIDASEFPKMVASRDASETADVTNVVNVQKGSGMSAHTCLLRTIPATDTPIAQNTNVNYKNIYFIGNAEIGNDVTNSGGLLMMKNRKINFNAYNTVTHNFYIGYFFELGGKDNPNDGEYVLNKIKSYNSYQTQLYSWGGDHIVIKNSEILGAGGPAIIADHCNFQFSGGTFTVEGNYTGLDIINTKLESKISGKEPWFEQYPGTSQIAANLLLLEAFFDGSAGLPALNKTIIADKITAGSVETGRLNAIVLLKRNGEGATNGRCFGYARFFDNEEDYNKYYSTENPVKTTFGLDLDKNSSLIDNALQNDANYIEASGNGVYINSGYGSANQDSNINPHTNKFYDQGDYINLYTNMGMGIVIQMYDNVIK